jgi:hypothetical protein
MLREANTYEREGEGDKGRGREGEREKDRERERNYDSMIACPSRIGLGEILNI